MDENSEPYSLVVSEKANEDIDNATTYFDELQAGLGDAFYAEFLSIARLITKSPELYEEKLFFLRRGLMKRFRFQIYYALDDINREIEVVAIIHQSQHPDTIKERINIDF